MFEFPDNYFFNECDIIIPDPSTIDIGSGINSKDTIFT